MRTRSFLFLTLLPFAAAQAALPGTPRSAYIPGELIVVYEQAVSAKRAGELAGLPVRRTLLHGQAAVVQVPSFADAEAAMQTLAQRPGIRRVERNARRWPSQTTPNDPLFDELWGIRNTGQANYVSGGPAGAPGGDLNLLPAWDPAGDGSFPRTGDGSVVIAIIDDAFDLDHPELAANFAPGQDLAGNDANPRPDDASLQPHGTLVTGAAAAIGNNGSQIAGSIWNVSVVPLKVSRLSGSGSNREAVLDTASILEAYQAAIDAGAHIVNASFGGPGFSQTEMDKIAEMRDAGILFVTSAGNDDSNLDLSGLNFPAGYPLDNIVAVAATNRQDNIASFSVYGPTTVEVAAPGLQILSTEPGGGVTPFGSGNGGGVAGTSFSSPYTAGVAALIRNYQPTADLYEMRARLVESGTAVSGANADALTRGGRVDAARALDMLPGPSLVLAGYRFDDGNGGNGQPDPGETLDLVIEIENLWLAATGVTATVSLQGGSGLEFDQPQALIGPVAGVDSRPANRVEARFPVTVTAAANTHQYADILVRITADGGYDRSRHLRLEVASLQTGDTVSASFAGRNQDLYDEFHAWHLTLDQPADSLVIATTTPAGEDIDLLVRKDQPPKYLITLGIDPETGDSGFFDVDDGTLVSGEPDGNERIEISPAPAGTYHLVIVNFDQSDTAQRYTLRATTAVDSPPVADFSVSCDAQRICRFDGSLSTDDDAIVAYAWTFGDGGTSSLQQPTHTYARDGQFQVRLTVTDTANQTATTTRTVAVGSPGGGGGGALGSAGLLWLLLGAAWRRARR